MFRRLFDSFTLRERIGLVLFIWLAVLLWLTVIRGNWVDRQRAYVQARSDLNNQQVLIDNRDFIEERVAVAREGIDPSRTYSGSELFSHIDNLARQSELAADISSPTRREERIFNTNSVRVSVRRASLEQLISFVHSVRSEAPYLALRRFQIDANQRDPRQLNAQLEIESFELAESYF